MSKEINVDFTGIDITKCLCVCCGKQLRPFRQRGTEMSYICGCGYTGSRIVSNKNDSMGIEYHKLEEMGDFATECTEADFRCQVAYMYFYARNPFCSMNKILLSDINGDVHFKIIINLATVKCLSRNDIDNMLKRYEYRQKYTEMFAYYKKHFGNHNYTLKITQRYD